MCFWYPWTLTVQLLQAWLGEGTRVIESARPAVVHTRWSVQCAMLTFLVSVWVVSHNCFQRMHSEHCIQLAILAMNHLYCYCTRAPERGAFVAIQHYGQFPDCGCKHTYVQSTYILVYKLQIGVPQSSLRQDSHNRANSHCSSPHTEANGANR